MTDKQVSSLRTTIAGAAFFIGGAIILLTSSGFATLFMTVGTILLIKDFVISLWMKADLDDKAKEKEERKNDTY